MLQIRQMLIEVLTGVLPLSALALALTMALSTPSEVPDRSSQSNPQEQTEALELSIPSATSDQR